MQYVNVTGSILASGVICALVSTATWAVDPATLERGAMQRTALDITCSEPRSEQQGMMRHDLKALIGPGIDANRRQRAMRQLFAAEHYRLRDGLTDYE